MKRRLIPSSHFLLAACLLGSSCPVITFGARASAEPKQPVESVKDIRVDKETEAAEAAELAADTEEDSVAKDAPPAASAIPLAELIRTLPTGKALTTAWTKAEYRFTPEVRAAFLAFSKEQARTELAAAHETLPAEFLAWVDSEPLVEASVYGIKSNPANVLRILRSLDLDLGSDVVRRQYTQLALAMAVGNADHRKVESLGVNLAERPVMKLVIPPNPLKPVNTNDPNRTLDANDHIINFLNSRPFEYEVKIKPAKKGDPITVEKRSRPMVGADVIKNTDLQAQFNAYMEAKGQTLRVDCLAPHPRKYAQMGPTLKAYEMFRAAYEDKGLLAKRDRPATLAETAAFLIRNDQYVFPPEVNRPWPLFPLKAPWPALIFLAVKRDPLRECQDIWENYRDTGRGVKKGPAYLGPIAQKLPLVYASAVAPLEFGYGSVQMLCLHGGVCGTLSGVAVRTQLALGLPSCTTREVGHCGTSGVRLDAATNTYKFGSAIMPAPWPFSNPATETTGPRRSVLTGFSVNLGMPQLLDSMMAVRVLNLLPDADRQAHGLELLKSGLEINPYNVLLVEAAGALDPVTQLHLMKWLGEKQAAVNKPGCPVFLLHAQETFAASVYPKPAPPDKEACREIYAYLMGLKNVPAPVLARYQTALEGLPANLALVEEALTAHLAAPRTPANCRPMAARLSAIAMQIPDKKERKAWALKCYEPFLGREMFFGSGNSMILDPTAEAAAKLAGQKLRSKTECTQSRLDEVSAALQANVTSNRDIKVCRVLASKLIQVSRQLKDETQKRQWLETLSKTMAGHETFQAPHKKQMIEVRDPCADAIVQLLAPPVTAKAG